jgi:hypothetical protein
MAAVIEASETFPGLVEFLGPYRRLPRLIRVLPLDLSALSTLVMASLEEDIAAYLSFRKHPVLVWLSHASLVFLLALPDTGLCHIKPSYFEGCIF